MPKKKEITQEMLDDLSRMGDKAWASKHNTARTFPILLRKKLGIPPFTLQHNLRQHRFEDGKELKYCPRDGGHWDDVSNFGKANNRYDGLRGICKYHESYRMRELHAQNPEKAANRAKAWKQTDSGKISQRGTWRRVSAKKKNAYVIWLPEHEQRAYDYFGGRCAYCGKPVEFLKIEFDHFIPIKSGGKTHPSNMLPCCKKCNHGIGGKYHKEALEWLIEKFGELNGKMIYLVCQTALEHLGSME